MTNQSKKLKLILDIAYSERHCYADSIPYHYGIGSRGYDSFKKYMKDVAFFSNIKDFSKIRGLKEAFEQAQIECYDSADWRIEYPNVPKDYIEYYEICQKAANDFLRGGL
jgi:hypothetical protein